MYDFEQQFSQTTIVKGGKNPVSRVFVRLNCVLQPVCGRLLSLSQPCLVHLHYSTIAVQKLNSCCLSEYGAIVAPHLVLIFC